MTENITVLLTSWHSCLLHSKAHFSLCAKYVACHPIIEREWSENFHFQGIKLLMLPSVCHMTLEIR